MKGEGISLCNVTCGLSLFEKDPFLCIKDRNGTNGFKNKPFFLENDV